MNVSKNQSVTLGVFLIALGVVALFGLWDLLLPGALLVAGVVLYTQRRRTGRTVEAVQGGLWGIGLALLFVLHLLWPGILLLAGASILLRGREFAVDTQVQQVLGRAQASTTPRTPPSQNVPITIVQEDEQAVTNETRRLS